MDNGVLTRAQLRTEGPGPPPGYPGSMSKKLNTRDHGTFTIHAPQESTLLVHLSENAMKNPEKPGEAFGRIAATRTLNGRTEQGFKKFHLNLHTQKVVITEEWAGREIARKTIALDAVDHDQPDDRPVSLPDPGPATPTYYRLSFRAADLDIAEELRDWAKERADQDVLGLSVLPRRIRLFGEGFQEVVTLPQPFAADLAPGTGATLKALRERRGVERQLVEGWFASGDGRGTAWILDIGEDDGWWLGMRAFERRSGMLGVWTSAWFNRVGVGSAALLTTLRPIIDLPVGERAIVVGEPKAPPQPELGMFAGTLGPNEPVPGTAQAVAERVGASWEPKLHTEPPEGARLTVFRGSEWETWHLDGDFPAGLDDMIRAIAARGDPPTSLALVRMGIIPLEGEPYRAMITEGEALGRRYVRALVTKYGPNGEVVANRLALSDPGEIGHNGWIGVEPITDLALFVIGAAEA